MDQEEHLAEQNQQKFFTRSTARHLRRKRLHDARRAEKQQECLLHGSNVKFNQEFIIERDTDQPELITKSKARRLRKRSKTQVLQNCCSFCESYCRNSLPVIETVDDQDVAEKHLQDVETITKSKARRLRKKNITNLVQNTCSFCYDTYVPFDPFWLKYIKYIKLSNIFSLKSTEPDRSGIAPSLTSSGSIKMIDNKMSVSEKTREEVKAEREAKKAAKALAKLKGKIPKAQDTSNNKLAGPDSTKNSETPERTTNEKTQLQKKTPVTNKTSNTCTKSAPSEVNNEGKSKAELRAERRAKQDAQRAAKQQQLLQKNRVNSKETDDSARVIKGTDQRDAKKIVTPKKTVQKDNTHEINLFKHLYHEREKAIVDVPSVNSKIHPVIVRLGTQYAEKVIVGSNARCVALLAAVKRLIQDFERPSQADFIRGLEASLQESVAYLHHCRPLAVSMQNALRHLKRQMTQLSSVSSDADAKSKLSSGIDTYIQEQIQLADKAISITIQTKISNGDVILTYGYSSLIHKILLDAHIAGKQFCVVVVDGRPWLEGKEQLRRLTKHGIECSYIMINALSYVMPEVSKVFLGAHAILANGAVMSRVGTAQVALMAKAFNIPVLVACETHKSCERVQTDSIVYNELGNANELAQGYGLDAKKSLLANWKTKKSLNLLNITYDVTPADLVTAVVTELAILPCTSVPVILRIKPTEI